MTNFGFSACLGAALLLLHVSGAYPAPEALCGGRPLAVSGGVGGEAPTFDLAVDGVRGPFLIDYGATQSSLSAAAFGGAEGATKPAALPLPGLDEQAFPLHAYDPASARIGILGTDVLSRLTVQLEGADAFVGTSSCDAEALRRGGFVPIAQAGFFAADPGQLNSSRANVPVVFLRIGTLGVWAQIDTGYSDTLFPHSADINPALYDRLVASGLSLERVAGVRVKTCEGVENRSVYAARDTALAIENEQGAKILRTEDFRLIVKSANGCGGIGGMTSPAAQLGASFLDLFGATIFDPKAGIVWLRGGEDAKRQ